MKTLLSTLMVIAMATSLLAAPGGVKGPNPDKASPVALEAFLKHHPELREKLAKMTPEERKKFIEEKLAEEDKKKPEKKTTPGKKA